MGLKQALLGAFNFFRGQNGVTDAGQGFDFRSFDRDISQLLAENGISNVRQVGGTFRMTEKLADMFKSTMFQQDFDVATVVLSDVNAEKASAYMVGRCHDGSYAIRSLHNIARPHDLNNPISRIQARIYAHGYRETLKAHGELMREESSNGILPEQYMVRGRNAAMAFRACAIA